MNKKEIENLIKELIEKTTVKVSKIDILEEKNSNILFSVEVGEPHFFINHEGEALYAVNHLVRRMMESQVADNESPLSNVMVDINNFQKKRIDSVRAVAHMMSERARYFKSSIEVDPMSAFERRIVHEFLSDATDLKTESVGFGSARRVVIKYIGNASL